LGGQKKFSSRETKKTIKPSFNYRGTEETKGVGRVIAKKLTGPRPDFGGQKDSEKHGGTQKSTPEGLPSRGGAELVSLVGDRDSKKREPPRNKRENHEEKKKQCLGNGGKFGQWGSVFGTNTRS